MVLLTIGLATVPVSFFATSLKVSVILIPSLADISKNSKFFSLAKDYASAAVTYRCDYAMSLLFPARTIIQSSSLKDLASSIHLATLLKD